MGVPLSDLKKTVKEVICRDTEDNPRRGILLKQSKKYQGYGFPIVEMCRESQYYKAEDVCESRQLRQNMTSDIFQWYHKEQLSARPSDCFQLAS